MDVDFSTLDEALETTGVDAYLIQAAGDDADQAYLAGFWAPDPFVTLYRRGEIHLLVRALERGRARQESRATSVTTGSDYGEATLREEHGQKEADQRILRRFLADHEVKSVLVPEDFPIVSADSLREHDVAVTPDRNETVTSIRAVKTDAEVNHIKATQRATERAMKRAEDLITAASVDGDILTHKTAPLTSERVKEEVEVTLLRQRCAVEDIIVAGGAQGADPHHRGSGVLRANEPIVIDIFPRHRETRYFADMTRTFCVGEPSEMLLEWHELTKAAQEAAFEQLGPGESGAKVHVAVCEVYEDAGIPTLRTDEGTETGFIHGTGHGIGLEIHESPRLSTSEDILRPGHVVTVEPGVYDPEVGGVRIEDIALITEDGYENLTSYHKEFVL